MTDTQNQDPGIQDKPAVAQAASQALVQQNQRRPLAMTNGRVVLTTFEELHRFCQTVCYSGMVPPTYDATKVEPKKAIGAAMVAIQHGAELGMSPLSSLQGIASINGKPSLYGDAFWARVVGHPDYEDHKEVWNDQRKEWTCSLKRKGKEWKSHSFGFEDAKQAGLLSKKGPWSDYPKRQAQWRARSWCARDVFPDAFGGVWLAMEAEDMPALPPAVATQEPVEGVHHFGSKKKTLPPPSLDHVLEQIADASTVAELERNVSPKLRLLSADEQETALEPYNERKRAIEAGEVLTDASGNYFLRDPQTSEVRDATSAEVAAELGHSEAYENAKRKAEQPTQSGAGF